MTATVLADRPTTSPPPRRATPAGIGLVVAGTVACAVVLAAGYLGKRRCVGPTFDKAGRSGPDWQIRINGDLCYSDIQQLWLGRGINLHLFPYVHGGITASGQLTGGSVEYPVLTGLAMYLAGLGSHDDGQFLAHGALLLAPFGIVTAALLFALAGRRGWWFALAPALLMYGFLSWDLLPVAATTVGCAAMVAGPARWTRRRRAMVAAVAFGLGGAAKFYPLMFVAPVVGWILWPVRECTTDDPGEAPPSAQPALDVRGAVLVAGAGLGTWLAVNAPFAVAGFPGWWAAFEFQWSRPIDLTTNSIWFWAGRPDTDPDNGGVQQTLAWASTAATAVGMLAALAAGAIRCRRGRCREYPWLQVGAAMLCAYLLLNKVHSPQYTLWLLPFFVVLRVRAGWIVAYYLADLAMGIGFFRWQYLIVTHRPNGIYDNWPAQALMIGVWGRAALLVGLSVAFLNARSVSGGALGAQLRTGVAAGHRDRIGGL